MNAECESDRDIMASVAPNGGGIASGRRPLFSKARGLNGLFFSVVFNTPGERSQVAYKLTCN